MFVSNLMVVPRPEDYDHWKAQQLKEKAEMDKKLVREDLPPFQNYGGRSAENIQQRKERQKKRVAFWNTLLDKELIDYLL